MPRTKPRSKRGTAGRAGRKQDRPALPVTRCTREYRVAAADTFTPGPDDDPSRGPVHSGQIARLGHLHAERAERELRARLAAGERPPVLLVSPERAKPARIYEGGRVLRVWAWAPPTATDNGVRRAWAHCPHVVAELDAIDHEPDPASDHYAAGGSVLVRDGWVRRLTVSSWLAPVAGQLADRYGVPVDVDPTPELPEAPPLQPGAVVYGNVLPAEHIEILRSLPKPNIPMPPRTADYRPPRVAGIPPADEWDQLIGELLLAIGERLGLPVNATQYAVLYYRAGDMFAEHTDRTDDANTWDRTVSFSLLLSEPGEDFVGGQFEVEGQAVELHRGDLIGFTAATRHAVGPVVSGRRLCLVAFGEWRR